MVFSIHTFELTGYFETKGKPSRKNPISLVKGIEFAESGNSYAKTVRLKINPSKLLGGDDLELWETSDENIDRLIGKLEKLIHTHFNSKLNDFTLSRCDFTVNIDVESPKRVSAYIKVLHNSGKVTGFSPKFDSQDYDSGRINKDNSFDLVHKDGVEFTAYDKWNQTNRKKGKGVLRAEVRLKKRKAIHKYTKETDTAGQIKELSRQCEKIFMKTFQRIVPPGNYYTMKEAVKRVAVGVSKQKQRDKMLKIHELRS